jgi:MSHA biogenesis protein MshK
MKAMHYPYLAAVLLSMSAQAAADGLVDPTRPPQAPGASASTSPETLRVEAVLRSAERDLAIVNGKVVRAGDRVCGVRVEAILADGIRYTRDGQVHIARLQQASIPVRQ